MYVIRVVNGNTDPSCKLYDTIQNVVRWWDLESRERDITTNIDASSELQQQWIVSDSQRVSQVLINFLMNAIRCA